MQQKSIEYPSAFQAALLLLASFPSAKCHDQVHMQLSVCSRSSNVLRSLVSMYVASFARVDDEKVDLFALSCKNRVVGRKYAAIKAANFLLPILMIIIHYSG